MRKAFRKHIPSTALGAAALFLIQQAWPPQDVWSSLGVIFGVGFLIIAVGVWWSESSAPTAQEIAQEIRGGNNFCYFQLYNSNPKSLDGPFQLAMVGIGIVKNMNYWIAPASSRDPTSPSGINNSYWSLDRRKPLIQIVHSGGYAWDRALPVGEYWIDFTAENGYWTEMLNIYISNGELKQYVRVTRNGNIIYDSDPPNLVRRKWWSWFTKSPAHDTSDPSPPKGDV